MAGAKKNPLKFKDAGDFPMAALEEIITEKDKLCLWKKPFEPKVLSLKRFPLASRPKPSGVWYGCGLSWLDWVSSEMPDWLHQYLYKITFSSKNMLKMSTAKALDDFSEDYGELSKSRVGDKAYYNSIHWEDVAEDYSGIEICPYIQSRRWDGPAGWYGGWDVASGCIWDTSIITKVEEITLDE